MEIFMILPSNLPHMQTFGKEHGNFHYLAMKRISRYMEISIYFAICFVARYLSMYLFYGIAKKVYGNFLVSVYPRCPNEHGNFRKPALLFKRTLKRSVEHNYHRDVPFLNSWIREA